MAFCEVEHASFRLQPSLTRQPVCSEALMIFLELWFGLMVRYRLPRQRRIEGPSSSLVLNLFCSGSLWLDHFPFAFSLFFRD
jgi:hypothetical protein